jgi:hypothetical protein
MQNEINLNEIEFDEKLLENVSLFDGILSELGEPPLFENSNFRVFTDITTFPTYLVMETTQQKTNTLPMMIWFEGDDLVIDLDGMRETFEWSKKQIEEDKNSVLDFIRNLLTGYVLIETHGASRFVQIFDESGFFAHSYSYNNLFHMVTGLYLFRKNSYRQLYLPMFFKKR